MTRRRGRNEKVAGKRIGARSVSPAMGGSRTLANPRRRPSSRAVWIGAGGVSLVALVLYCRTLAPTVTFVDSGELIVAARSAGVPHPPGFPLWVMLAHLASLVPIGNVAVRVNFTSALFAALACGVFTLLVAELMMIASGSSHVKAPRSKGGGESDDRGFVILAPAVTAGLLLAFSRTLWSYATIAEVYALNTLLIAMVLFAMFRWLRLGCAGAPTEADPWIYGAAFVFGLGLGVHHVTILLLLPSLAWLVWKNNGPRFFGSRRLLLAGLCAIAGLIAVYAYLPVAASRAPLVNWGDPRSLTKIWWHVTGRQYQGFFEINPDALVQQLGEIARMVLREFGPKWMPLALMLAAAGFCSLFRNDRRIFWFLVLLVSANLAYSAAYNIAEDGDAYLLPTFLAVTIAVGFGLRWLLEILPGKLKVPGVVAASLLPAIALLGNWPFNDRSNYFVAHDYVENILSTIEPGGLLLTWDWQVASPMLYAREIERRRRDVKVVDVNLLRRSWYFDYLRRAYPDLVARSQGEIERFLAELTQWELDPRAYGKSAVRTQRITSAFLALCQALVRNEARVAPVYLSSDVRFRALTDDREFSAWLVKNHQLVPRGLVFRLSQNPGLEDPGEWDLQTRGLADGTLKFERDDVVQMKVLPAYTRMLVNRGQLLTRLNQPERAAAAFEEALALDPTLEVAREGLRTSKRPAR